MDSDEAEDALCHDRPGFIMRREILKLIPGKIKKHITHPGDNAQIKGFQELFVYLNKHPGPERLRRAVAAFFDDTVHLRPHLSQSLLHPASRRHFNEIAMLLITELSTAASSRIVDTDMADGAHTSMSDNVFQRHLISSAEGTEGIETMSATESERFVPARVCFSYCCLIPGLIRISIRTFINLMQFSRRLTTRTRLEAEHRAFRAHAPSFWMT